MFIAQLEKLCKENGTTVSTIAKELGFSMGSVSQWRKGSCPRSDVVVRFADYFSVTTDYLLKGEEPQMRLKDEKEKLNMSENRTIDTSRDGYVFAVTYVRHAIQISGKTDEFPHLFADRHPTTDEINTAAVAIGIASPDDPNMFMRSCESMAQDGYTIQKKTMLLSDGSQGEGLSFAVEHYVDDMDEEALNIAKRWEKLSHDGRMVVLDSIKHEEHRSVVLRENLG